MSFTAGTKVLLARRHDCAYRLTQAGREDPVREHQGWKEPRRKVAAVLVHHDTDLFDLKVRTAQGIVVIHTTSSHLFWDPTAHRWVKAAALGPGSHLRTPVGATAMVANGHAPRNRAGWMWDLTVTTDHDFYIICQFANSCS